MTTLQLFYKGEWVAVTAAESRCSVNNYWSFKLAVGGKFVFVSHQPRLSCGKPVDLECGTCPSPVGGLTGTCEDSKKEYKCPEGQIGYVSE